MQNKSSIIYIIVANLLWSLIPVIVLNLFNEISIITIIFLRFFVSGILLFCIALILIHYNNRYTSNDKIFLRQSLQFTQFKNETFFNLKNIIYFSILGFVGIILHILGYFLTLKTTSIAFAMIGFQVSIIMVALYDHGSKSERLDFFKILYLILLMFSIWIIIIIELQQSSQGLVNITLVGFSYIALFSCCLAFFHIVVRKDHYHEEEILIINRNQNYKIIRLILKTSLTFILGVFLMIPLLLFILIFPIKGDLSIEVEQFFIELPRMIQVLFRWEIIFLILFSTITPFMLIFLAGVNWSTYNLTFSQWASILTIIEPFGALFFGVLFMKESFPIEFLIIVLFILAISILFRYAHETRNKINAFIILKLKQSFLKNTAVKLLKIEGITSVDSLVGSHDLLLNVKTNSIKSFYFLMNNTIRKINGVSEIKILFINEINKIDN